MTEEAQVLLHDEQAERQVLGCMMQYADAFRQSADYITADAFRTPVNRYIYQCIGEVVSAGNTPDIVQLAAYVMQHPQKGIEVNPAYIAECSSSVISSSTFTQNCLRLADLHRRRQMYLIGHKLMQAGTSEINDTDEIKAGVLQELQSLDDTPQATVKGVRDALKELGDIVCANLSGQRAIGVPTGFTFLDLKGGLQPTDLWIVAGEFSQGKTSFALDLCVNAARNGQPTAFYSTEMMSTQLAARMLAGESGIPSRRIMQEALTDTTLQEYDRAVGKLERLPIYFDDTSTLSVERIIASIRTLARKKGVKVAFIDYLQVLQTNERNMKLTEEQFFGLTARRFKNLAKELQISVVLLSQIARSKDTTEPTLSRIRGSGQISEAADVVLLIYRPEVYDKRYSGTHTNVSTKGTALIKLAKGRNIGTGDFICGYNAPATHFYELQEIPRYQEGEISAVRNEDSPF